MATAVIGNIFVDIKGFPFDKYIEGGRNAGKIVTVHGGVGRNVAEDLARLALRPVFISLADDNAQGDEIVERLAAQGVNTEYILRVPEGMGVWLAVFNERGDIVGSISRRPDSSALAKLIEEKGEEIFSRCDSVAVEFDIGREIVEKVLDITERLGKKVYAVISNMTLALQQKELFRRMECIVCNSEEAEMLFGVSLADLTPAELSEKLPALTEKEGFRSIVVTMGESGAVFARNGGESGRCKAEDVTVLDTTGAGDAFFAGVAAGLSGGRTMAEAVRLGTHLAASTITSEENVCAKGISL